MLVSDVLGFSNIKKNDSRKQEKLSNSSAFNGTEVQYLKPMQNIHAPRFFLTHFKACSKISLVGCGALKQFLHSIVNINGEIYRHKSLGSLETRSPLQLKYFRNRELPVPTTPYTKIALKGHQ